ncbi:MAG: hypothetical protein HC815_39625 [Richelia sp. RM1_1_1]|nr:hypothetical protein [Richelia sp. RM1_1_1]
MKKNNRLISLIVISSVITFLVGCKSFRNYGGDIGRGLKNYGDDAGRSLKNSGDDAGRSLKNSGNSPLRIDPDTTNQGIEILGEATKITLDNCAKDSGKSVLEQLVKKAISSGYTQISQGELLEISKSAIHECVVIKAGQAVHDSFVNESASSNVMQVQEEYQGQIEFTN